MGCCSSTLESPNDTTPDKLNLNSKSTPSSGGATPSMPDTNSNNQAALPIMHLQQDSNSALPQSFRQSPTPSSCNFDECGAVSRLQHILSKQDEEIAKHGAFAFIHNHLGNYSTTHLINDYHHAMYVHEHQFEDIYNKLSATTCNLDTCTSFRRNHRNRCDESVRQTEYQPFLATASDRSAEYVTKELNIVQIIDQIHCYFLHSFDCLYRLTKAEQDKLQQEIEEQARKDQALKTDWDDQAVVSPIVDEADDEEEEGSFPDIDVPAWNNNNSQSIRAMSDRLWRNDDINNPRRTSRFAQTAKTRQKDKYCQIARMLSGEQSYDTSSNAFGARSRSKFGFTASSAAITEEPTQIKSEDDIKVGATDDSKNVKNNPDKFGMENDLVYSFGVRFVYDIDGKAAYWYVRAKHDSLKSELLNNNEFKGFLVTNWDITHEGAKTFMQAEFVRETCKYVDTGDTVRSAGDRKRSGRKGSRKSTGGSNIPPMSISHMIAVMIYCNFTELQAKFTESYRKLPGESDDDLKRRHSEWHHLGRFLREVVEIYGTRISSEENRLRIKRKRDDVKLRFYHGINREMVFVSTTAKICGPLSTSSDMFVALNFAGREGLLLELSGSNAHFFDCAVVSNFANESEKLFLGGYDPLVIETIINPKVGNYMRYVQAMNIVSCLFSGEQYYSKKAKRFTKSTQKLVVSLLRYNKRCDAEKDDGNTVPLEPYIQKLFAHYCSNTVDVVIDWNLMNKSQDEMFPHIKGFKFIKNEICMASYQWIKMNRVVGLFANIKTLQLNYIQLSHKVMQYILNTLEKKQHDGNYSSLKKIIIAQPTGKKLSVHEAISTYSEQFVSKINWIMVVEDTNNYTDLVIERLASPSR